jgi:hypothetical protein
LRARPRKTRETGEAFPKELDITRGITSQATKDDENVVNVHLAHDWVSVSSVAAKAVPTSDAVGSEGGLLHS